MKAVLISIQPCWCEQIVAGTKTMEVRKNVPRQAAPFKCYIYQTKARWVFDLLRKINFDYFADILEQGFGKVIGEFVCDCIRPFDVPYPAFQNEMDKDILEQTCCTYYQLHRYAYHDKLYGWHISKLVIYPKPKKLSDFFGKCDKPVLFDCSFCHEYGTKSCKQLTRPPQSWCYVEDNNTEV